MKPSYLVLLAAFLPAAYLRADTVVIDVTKTDKAGCDRYCFKVTNDDEDELYREDHVESIWSFHVEVEDGGFATSDVLRDHTTAPDGFDDGVTQDAWGNSRVDWKTEDAAKAIQPGGDGTFCFVAEGPLEIRRMWTDYRTEDPDSGEVIERAATELEQDVSPTEANDTDFLQDTDGDGIADAHDSHPDNDDPDGDGKKQGADNCPDHDNPGQEDADGDGLGDACDPRPSNPDCDDDGISDGDEVLLHGTDPQKRDSDGDGFWDFEEIDDLSDPNDPASTPEVQSDGIDNDLKGLVDENFDYDDDGLENSLDLCAFVPSVHNGDGDGDRRGDACDFDDGILLFERSEGPLLVWQVDEAALSYNLYRGSLELLRAFGDYSQLPGTHPAAAWWCDLPDNTLLDAFVPVPGDPVYWIVTANGLDGEFGAGTTGAGDERPVADETSCSGDSLPATWPGAGREDR